MASELSFRRIKRRVIKRLLRLIASAEVSIFAAFLLLGWLAASLVSWREASQGRQGLVASGQTVNCPERNGTLGQEGPFNMTAHQAKLVAQIRAKAPLRVVERCVQMVMGDKWTISKAPFHRPFSQGYQDWIAYHSFFSRMEYGEGFYIDVGASDPINGSNTYFFDACLGWQGLCVEPDPTYAESFRAHRTCTQVTNCVGPNEADLHLLAEQGPRASISENGEGIAVRCRPLETVLVEQRVGMTHKGQRRINFASIDIEGFEYKSLRCFPFGLFDIPLWVMETAHQKEHSVDTMMARAGYWMSPQILVPWKRRWLEQPPSLGYHYDNLFVRWRQPSWILGQNASVAEAGAIDTSTAGGKDLLEAPPLVLGPDFLPGRVLEGESFVAPCSGRDPLACPEQVPAVEDEVEFKDGAFISTECKAFHGVKHRLSSPRFMRHSIL